MNTVANAPMEVYFHSLFAPGEALNKITKRIKVPTRYPVGTTNKLAHSMLFFLRFRIQFCKNK